MSKFSDERWATLLQRFEKLKALAADEKFIVQYDGEPENELVIDCDFREVYFKSGNCHMVIFNEEEADKDSARTIINELKKRIAVFHSKQLKW